MRNGHYNEMNKAMRKSTYSAPEAEVLIIRMEENFLVYNIPFEEDEDDIFGDGNE